MNLSNDLVKTLKKRYSPSTLVAMKYNGKDLAFKTDKEGNPVSLFIGKALGDGKIKGERFTRVLIKNADGTVLKDHWDRKGTTE